MLDQARGRIGNCLNAIGRDCKRWPISHIVFLTAFCLISFATCEAASNPIQLADCNFWVAIVWQGAIQPLGNCFKADWSTPEIVPTAKSDQSIPIPSDWAKGVNPPPLKWQIVCQDWEHKDMAVTKVKTEEDKIILQPESPILGSSCVAIAGNLTVQLPKDKMPARMSEGEIYTIATLDVKSQNIRLMKQRFEDGEGISLTNTNGENIFECSESYSR